MSDEDVEGLDEEFLYHLNRGAGLLAEGELDAARAALSRASELRPRDPKSLGLFGQSLYKLGRYDEAIEVYGKLVDVSPVEAAARVNLGLANLKAKHYTQAVRQLEIALDLNPDHKKAMGYLGLAWLEQGDFTRARGWFERAGSEPMVAKCDELLALRKDGTAASKAPTPERPSGAPALATAQAAPEVEVPAAPQASSGGAQGLAAFVTARLFGLRAESTFAVERGLLTVAVRGEVLVREEGLLAVRGAVGLVPEMKRFRGRATEKPFGHGARRMLRASGQGALLYRVGGARLATVDLEGESPYFLEGVVFAFEETVSFENGRVASRFGQDLNLVHLRGHGRVLLTTRGEIAALEVTAEAPLRVPLAALVGWTGALTPRVIPIFEAAGAAAEGAPGEPLVVELGGDGRALVDEGAAG
jgi:uncharacterized protein (AIM24 family)